MKFNWGTGIAIGIGIFMIFILQYVIRVQIDSKYDNELVTEDYYQKEVNVDSDYNKQANARKLANPLQISETGEGITIRFPNDFDFKQISGTIFLYRPSNQKLDFEIPISLSSSNLLIPKQSLVDGRWNISIDWKYQGEVYLNKKNITL